MPTLHRLLPGTRFRLAEMPEVIGVLVKANECRAVVWLDRAEREVEFVDHDGTPRQFKCRGGHTTSWAPTTVVEPAGFSPLLPEEIETMSTKNNTKKSKKAPTFEGLASLLPGGKATNTKSGKAETPTTTKARVAKVKAIEKMIANDPDLGLVAKEPDAVALGVALETQLGKTQDGDAPGSQLTAEESDKLATVRTKKQRKAEKPAKTDGKLSCLDAAAKVLGESQEPMSTKAMIEQMAAKKYWTSPGGKTPAATLYSAILREINTKGKESRFKKTERGHFALA